MSAEQFLNPLPPINPNSNYTLGNSLVVLYAVTTSTANAEIPDDFRGAMVTLIASGGTVTFLCGVDSAMEVDNTLTGLAAGKRSSKLGRTLLDTQEIDVLIPAEITRIAFQGSASCTLRMIRSSGNVRPVVAT